MTHPFLITGLPRSRTAWFAALCSTGDAFCYHEPIVGLPDWRHVYRLWRESNYTHTGIADSVAGFHLQAILDEMAPQTLLIERPINDVVASLRRWLPGQRVTNFIELLAERLNEVQHPLVLRVPYAELQDPFVIAYCFRHLMKHAPYDPERAQQLMRLNIQVDTAYLHARAAAGFPAPSSFLGEDVASRLKVL